MSVTAQNPDGTSPVSSGILSINSLTGAVSIVAGANISSIGAAGSSITVNAVANRLAAANTSVPSGNTIANVSGVNYFASNYAIGAAALTVGQVLDLWFAGVYSTDATTPGTLTIGVYYGSTALCTGVITMSAGKTTNAFNGRAVMHVFTTGTSGTVEVQGTGLVQGAGNANFFMSNTSPKTINTTAGGTLQIGVTWSSVLTTNTATLRQFMLDLKQ